MCEEIVADRDTSSFLLDSAISAGNSIIHEFSKHEHRVDVAGDTSVVSFRYEMVHERSGERNQ